MLRMSNYGDNQPPSSEPTPSPYGQGQPNPYGQPQPSPYGQPTPNPYEQQQPPANPYQQPPGAANPYEQQQGQYQAATPAPYGAGYGQPYGAVAQEHPQGTIVLVLGIVGIFVGICAPIAWVHGQQGAGRDQDLGRHLQQRVADQDRPDPRQGVHDPLHRVHRAVHRCGGRDHRRLADRLTSLTPSAADAAGLGSDLSRLRRALHQDPELGLELPRTQAAVLDALAGLDLEISTGRDCTSVVAVLRGRGGDRAPAVLLRGDMDALPLTEQSGEPFAAPPGTMHACGHDLHTAGLVGAATLLSRQRDTLAGDVVFMFQPGEEGWDGAGTMIGEGVLDAAGPRVSAAYGLHVFASVLPRGVFATRPGPLMAASAALSVTVCGAGGHASRPHSAADPIVVAAEMVVGLQTLATRQFDVFDPVVITVGMFHAGTRSNIIPNEARFEGTVRALSDAVMDRVQGRVERLCVQLAAAYGLTAEVSFTSGYPVTVNDPERAGFALEVAAELFGARAGGERCPTRSWGRRTSPGCWPRCRARSCSSAPARRPIPRPRRATTRSGRDSTTAYCRTLPCCSPSWPGASWRD